MRSVKTRKFLAAGLIIASTAGLIFYHRPALQDKKLYRQGQLLMGTVVEVISPSPKAASIVFDEIRRLEHLLSIYDPRSEVSRLNLNGELKASADTFYLIKRSKEFWLASGGAFDITVSPLMDLWGFTNKQYRLPSGTEIADTLAIVGSDKIILQDFNNVVKFKLPGTKIDLGGIAKGFALDCSVKKLREAGIKDSLINIGGQVYCSGSNGRRPWRVAVKGPRGKNIVEYLELKDSSVATSGDYEQYFLKDGRRYAHILNPKTGYPANSGASSVTVIAQDGLTADALATAIFILGKDKGEGLAKQFKGAKVRIIEDDNVQNN